MFVNAIMYYKVQVSCDWSACSHVTPAPPLIGQDAIRAVTNVDDYAGSAQALAATTLRNVLGTRTLGDILSDRVKIAQEMHVGCSETWLVTVNIVITMPGSAGGGHTVLGRGSGEGGGEATPMTVSKSNSACPFDPKVVFPHHPVSR